MFGLTTPQIRGLSLPRSGREIVPLGLAGLLAALLIALPFPLDAAMILAPLAGILVLLYPALLPFALIASVPVQDVAPIPEGIPLTATRAAVLAAAAVTPLIVLGRGLPVRLPGLIPITGAFVAVLAITAWNARDPSLGYPELYRWGVAILAYWLVVQFVRTRLQALLVFGLFAVLAMFQGLYGAMQAVLGIGPESFEIGMGFSRAYGTFGMPNSYAAYLEAATIPIIPVFVWMANHALRAINEYRIQRLKGFVTSTRLRHEVVVRVGLALLLLGGCGVGLAGIAMSFSRGAWLGTAAGVAVILILLGRRIIVTSAIAGPLLALALMVGAPGPAVPVLEDRFTQLVDQVQIGDARGVAVTDDNFAVVERLAHWQTAIAMWDDNPWLGVGTGNFDSRFAEYAVHPDFTESQGHAHNYYLHLLAESGLAGLLLHLLVLAVALRVAWRAYRHSDSLARAIGIGALGFTAALLVHNVVENLQVLNISVQIFTIWALASVAVDWIPEPDHGTSQEPEPPVLYDSGVRRSGRAGADTGTGDREQR